LAAVRGFPSKRRRKEMKKYTCEFAQYEKLRVLFGAAQPSVTLFKNLLDKLPETEREKFYRQAFFLFMNAYNQMPVKYCDFLNKLVNNEDERFLKHFFDVSGFGEQRCKVKGKEYLIEVFHMLASKEGRVEASYNRLAFSLRLGFNIDLKTETLAHYIRKVKFYPETFFALAESVKIYF